MNTVFCIKHLTKYINKQIIIDDLSFECKSGEIFGFLGSNGAGKTTTLKMALGLMSIDSGEIWIDGMNIADSFEKAMNVVGGIIEKPKLYENLTAKENLELFARMRGSISEKRIYEMLSLVRLNDKKKEKLKSYSLGMRQRVGFAQALLHHPKVLLLDEPTNGLDPAEIRELRDILKNLAHKKNVCVIISSHLINEMELMCDRVCIIDKGKLVQVKLLNEMVSSFNEKAVFRFVVTPLEKARSLLNRLSIGTVITLQDEYIDISLTSEELVDLNRRFVENGIELHTVEPVDKKCLEDVFIEATGSRGDENV